MKFFVNCKTLEELKAEYRRLIKLHHPDRGGDTHDAEHQTTETVEEFRDIINALLKLDGLEVELCGCWLWIGGNTRPHAEALKALGCRWASKKKLWYWHHAEDGAHRSRGKRTMAQIRSKYGSQLFTGSGATGYRPAIEQ